MAAPAVADDNVTDTGPGKVVPAGEGENAGGAVCELGNTVTAALADLLGSAWLVATTKQPVIVVAVTGAV
jgi:hypothetical protein